MSDLLIILSAAAGEAEANGPTAFGVQDYQWVSLAMLVLFGVFIWKKVPSIVVRGLDAKIAEIKQQLDEAKSLRAEAEALRDQYAAKIAGAEKDAEAMMASAHEEASAILARAETDSTAMVARRQRMAEDKIAAAERTAIAEVKAQTVLAAAAAARRVIAERHDGEADKPLADQVIASL